MDAQKALVQEFFDNTAQTYDSIVKYTTFGKDSFWKSQIINQIPESSSILELACGTGILTSKIAQKFPHSKIIGVDITNRYLEIAKKKLDSNKNISFVCQDAQTTELGQEFDCIVSSYIPKYCEPKILISNCIKHLKPKGKIIIHDFTLPQNNVVRFFWNLHFELLDVIGNFIPEWKNAFAKLPYLIRSSQWTNEYKKELELHGFSVKTRHLTWGCCAILSGTRTPKNNILQQKT
jgi:demethylmenaquinone methyltransferase/2-methoxy-6-polyprenyl-1,4-benzoquinol methylase